MRLERRPAVAASSEALLFSVAQICVYAMVGRLGAYAIAVVGISGIISWFFYSAFLTLGVATTAVLARAVGAHDQRLARRVLRQAFLVTSLLAGAVTTAGLLLAPWVLSALGAAPDVIANGMPYLRLVFVSTLGAALNTTAGAALRGAGDTRTPLKVNLIATALNVGAVYCLVQSPFSFGLVGAGAALNISTFAGSAIFLALLTSRRANLRVSLRPPYRLDLPLVRRILRVGLPSAAEQVLLSGGILVFTRLVASLGTAALAAHQVASNLSSFSLNLGFGFSSAATTLSGQSLGADDPEAAGSLINRCRLWGVACMALVGGVLFFFGGPVARLYTADAAVIALCSSALRMTALVQPGMSYFTITAAGMRGAGDTRWPLYVTFVGLWTLRLGVAYYLVQLGWGLTGIWVGIAVDQWTRALLIAWRYRLGRWKEMTV